MDAAVARATATGLEPETEYQFRVSSETNGFSEWYHFTTASAEAQPFTFLYFGPELAHCEGTLGSVMA